MSDYPALQAGDAGYAVALLQSALTTAGTYSGDIDGVYGPDTTAAVNAYESNEGLTQDAVAGPDVWDHLDAAGDIGPVVDALYEAGVLIVEFARSADVTLSTVGGIVQIASASGIDVTALNAALVALTGLSAEPTYDFTQAQEDHLTQLAVDAGMDVPRLGDTFTFRFSSVDPVQLADQLIALPGGLIAGATPNYRVVPTASLPLNDPKIGSDDKKTFDNATSTFFQWYLYRCNALGAWRLSTGRAAPIAVLDSGFRLDATNPANSHEDLVDRANMSFAENIVDGTNVVNGHDRAHGTSAMGIAAATGGNGKGIAGFAYEAETWPIQVAANDGTISVIDVARAMWHAIRTFQGQLVLSLSLGYPRRVDAKGKVLQEGSLDEIKAIRTKLERCWLLETVACIAAGNNVNQVGVDISGQQVPDTGVVVVGGTTYGASDNPRWNDVYQGSGFGPNVNVCAPADFATSCSGSGGYTAFGGTSAATPMVAGTVALMRSVHPALDRGEVRQMLVAAGSQPTTDPAHPIGVFLNAGGAVRAAFASLKANHGQTDWRFCNKCATLYFDGGGSLAISCPTGGSHDATGSGAYLVVLDVVPAWAEEGWCWCSKCQGLYFGGPGPAGVCRAGGQHDGSSSGKYSLPLEAPPEVGQQDWRWCQACGLSTFGGVGAPNPTFACPAGGPHDLSAGGNYAMMTE